LACFVGFSQTQLSAEEQQAFKAKVEATAKNTKTIVSDFVQTKHLSVLDNDIVSKGRLVFESPNNILWAYSAPLPYQVIFKDNKLFVDNQGEKDVINLDSNKLFKSFNNLVVNSIKGNMFDEAQFDIAYFKAESGARVKFIPKERRLRNYIAAFELTFSETSAQVEQVKLIEPNEDYTKIVFKNRKMNVQVDSALFDQ